MSMEPSALLVLAHATITTVQTNWLPLEVCTRLWGIQTRISRDFNLHQLYETHRDLLFAMVGLEVGDILGMIQFQNL